MRSLQELSRRLRKRDASGKDAPLNAGAGHAVNGATGFILTNGEAALGVDSFHSFRSVGTHSSQDDSHGEVSVAFGHRRHQNVDGGNVEGIFGMRIKAAAGSGAGR